MVNTKNRWLGNIDALKFVTLFHILYYSVFYQHFILRALSFFLALNILAEWE